MRKLLLTLAAVFVTTIMVAQVTATSATYSITRDDGLVEVHKVQTVIKSIDNKNFTVRNVERVIIDGVIIENSLITELGTYNRDSSYYLFHNNSWNWFTGAQIQQAIAPVDTLLLHSLGRNLFYKTNQDSLWIPRTY